MTPEQERWAEALAVAEQHGDKMWVHVAERIGALAMEGDGAGVSRWRQIAAHLSELHRGSVQ
jgi:hypothetical protein